MVRFNILTVLGFIVSVASIPLFWFWLWLNVYSWGSGETELSTQLKNLQGALAVLFMVGTFLSLFSPLASALQAPGVIVIPIVLWYRDNLGLSDAGVVALYAVGLIGCALTVFSIFVQVFRECEPEQLIAWYRTWRATKESPADRIRPMALLVKMHRPAIPKRWLQVLVLSVLVALAGFTSYTITQPVSTLHIFTVFDPSIYGNELDVSVYVDNRLTSSGHVTGSGIIDFQVETRVDPGKHDVAVDFANATATLDGVWEYSTEVRVLPFTSEHEWILFGVAMI